MTDQFAHAEQQGNSFLWRYEDAPRSYRDWHFTATSKGCESLLAILDEIQAHRSPYRTINLRTPNPQILSVPGFHSRKPICTPTRMRIQLKREDRVSSMKFDGEASLVILSVNLTMMDEWKTALRYVIDDEGDFRLEMNNEYVWFWWCLFK